MCLLFILEEDKVVNIVCEYLEFVFSEKGDRVSIEGIVVNIYVKVYRLFRIGK